MPTYDPKSTRPSVAADVDDTSAIDALIATAPSAAAAPAAPLTHAPVAAPAPAPAATPAAPAPAPAPTSVSGSPDRSKRSQLLAALGVVAVLVAIGVVLSRRRN